MLNVSIWIDLDTPRGTPRYTVYILLHRSLIQWVSFFSFFFWGGIDNYCQLMYTAWPKKNPSRVHPSKFWLRFCFDERRVKPFLQSFPAHLKDSKGLKSGLCGGQFMCENVPWHSCVLMHHCFTTRARWILALSYWNIAEPSGKKKSIDGITWGPHL